MTKTINVGDKVRVLPGANSSFEDGSIVTVIENDYSSIPFYCESYEGDTEWMNTYEVELVSTELEDRVTALETELAELKASLAPKEFVASVSVSSRRFPNAADILAIPIKSFEYSVPTKNEERNAAIKLAQKSLADSFVVRHGKTVVWTIKYGGLAVQFIENIEKRTVVALLRYAWTGTDTIVARGVAKCDPTDVFNADIGKAIALDRALGRTTDERILRAPNPDEVVVGMKVTNSEHSYWGGGIVTRLEPEEAFLRGYFVEGDSYNYLDTAIILEDTGAQY